MLHPEDIEDIDDRIAAGIFHWLEFTYKGREYKVYCDGIDEEGNKYCGCVRAAPTWETIFVLPHGRPCGDVLDTFKIEGKTIRELFNSEYFVGEYLS